MGCIIYDDEVERIELGDGEWVDIKRKMSYGDRQKLIAYYAKLQTKLNSPDVDISLDMEAGSIMLLLLNIKAWSLKDRKGKPLPITKETIAMLDPDVARKLEQEIEKRNPTGPFQG